MLPLSEVPVTSRHAESQLKHKGSSCRTPGRTTSPLGLFRA